MVNSSDVEQVLLKHIREATCKVQLHHLEIEMRLLKGVTLTQFQALEGALAGCRSWEGTTDTETQDIFVDNVRITGTRAICKTRIAVTDVDNVRVCTSAEEPIPVPPHSGASFTRHKHRRERYFQGWKLALTTVNRDSQHPLYEVEVELDVLWLVRQPPEVLAKTGVKLVLDAQRLLGC